MEDHDDEDELLCFDCGEPHDQCECHMGAECGRWRNGVLSDSCSKAGSEECDFECYCSGLAALRARSAAS